MGSDLISACILWSLTRKLVALVSSSMSRVVAPSFSVRIIQLQMEYQWTGERTGFNRLLNVGGHRGASRGIIRSKASGIFPTRPGEVCDEWRYICLDDIPAIFCTDLECTGVGNYKLTSISRDYIVNPKFLSSRSESCTQAAWPGGGKGFLQVPSVRLTFRGTLLQ